MSAKPRPVPGGGGGASNNKDKAENLATAEAVLSERVGLRNKPIWHRRTENPPPRFHVVRQETHNMMRGLREGLQCNKLVWTCVTHLLTHRL